MILRDVWEWAVSLFVRERQALPPEPPPLPPEPPPPPVPRLSPEVRHAVRRLDALDMELRLIHEEQARKRERRRAT